MSLAIPVAASTTVRSLVATLLTAATVVATDHAGPTLHPGSARPVRPLPRPKAYYVSPAGTDSGDGSQARPWDIRSALAGASGRIQPGDTVWLRGGRYVGHFESKLTGTADAPIIVRQFPGERATLDNPDVAPGHSPKFRRAFVGPAYVTLKISGQWAWYWGFEVIHSSAERDVARTDGVYPTAPNNKFINLVVHDNAVGVSFSNESRNSEVYGCLIYDNGYSDIDRTHGHGIYTKNDGQYQKLIRDNVVFNQFRNGIQVYTDAGSGQLKNFLVEGNVWFNNGTLTGNRFPDGNMLVGGQEMADQIIVRHNMTYFSPGIDARNVRIGYTAALQNGTVNVQDNYFVGGTTVLWVGSWSDATMTGNLLFGTATVVDLNRAATGQSWSGNTHVRDPGANAWIAAGQPHTFNDWRRTTGLAATDTARSAAPAQPQVFVRPNRYEAGRANIIVYNWTRQPTVAVDVTGVLQAGDRYELRNVQDFYGSAVLRGTYEGGPLAVPMTGVEPPAPIGGSPGTARRTGPDFDVFVLSITATGAQ